MDTELLGKVFEGAAQLPGGAAGVHLLECNDVGLLTSYYINDAGEVATPIGTDSTMDVPSHDPDRRRVVRPLLVSVKHL